MLHIKQLQVRGIQADTLHIERGERVSVSGPSGAGKSLFLRGLADLDENEGEILLNGMSRNDLSAPDWRKKIAYVGPKVAWWLDRVGAHFTDEAWAQSVAGHLDLSPDILNWEVSRLSTGEAQRVALLRAIEGINDQVQYLLLDEPTSALDQSRQIMVEDLLNTYIKDKRIGLIFISHDDRQVQRFATRHWRVEHKRVSEVAP